MPIKTVNLTLAQAIITYLANQYIHIDGKDHRLCPGGFGIFGHGNVTCLGEALYQHRDEMVLYRGQNEQSMGFAAVAYAKKHLREKFMFCTASAGPGASNLVTSAALAHANRLPLLLLCGDTFLTRFPDPVLQQLENFSHPTLGVNDAFIPVTRFWDRITHPAQILSSLPQAIATLLDPAECGPVFLGLPQDVQGWCFRYPARFFAKNVHYIRRQSPDVHDIQRAATILFGAQRPLIIAGGGVQYSKATTELSDFAARHNIPMVETIAGRANGLFTNPRNIGPIGVTGSDSANELAKRADVIVAIGTRLQDFTTGSWSAFDDNAQFVSINVARHDAIKHQSVAVIGDAKLSLGLLGDALVTQHTLPWQAPESWINFASQQRNTWHHYVQENTTWSGGSNSYAHAIGVVNAHVTAHDRVIASAGGLPAELTANWKTLGIGTVDIEFGYSCMGYEIAGGWGARIAQVETHPDADTIVFVGDGSYLLLNSDIYSSVITQKKLIVVVLDNGGFAVINKLQNNTGNESYNNLFCDTPTATALQRVDFVSHAKALGAHAEKVANPHELAQAFMRAKERAKTSVLVMDVDAYQGWTTQGHTWWEVGTPSVSQSAKVCQAHQDWQTHRNIQRKGI